MNGSFIVLHVRCHTFVLFYRRVFSVVRIWNHGFSINHQMAKVTIGPFISFDVIRFIPVDSSGNCHMGVGRGRGEGDNPS